MSKSVTHISFYNSGIKDTVEWQKKVFDHFEIEIQQIETNLPHGEAIDKWLSENEFDRIYIWDADCIPLQKELPKSKSQILGCAQVANHLDKEFIYAGAFFISFTQTTYMALEMPKFAPHKKFDTAGAMSARAKSVELLWPIHVVQPKWDLGKGSTFGLGTTYQKGIYHAFESRMGNNKMFIDKCKEVLNG